MKISLLIKKLEEARAEAGDVEAIIMHHHTEYDCEPDIIFRRDRKTLCLDAGQYTSSSLRYFKKNPQHAPK